MMFRSAGPNNLYSPAATSDSSGFSELHAYNNYSTFNPVNNRNLESQQRCSSPQVPHSYHNPTLMASPYSTLPRRMTSHNSSGKDILKVFSFTIVSYRLPLCLKILKKILTFIVTSSVTFETFGDSFLPLENSFRFFQAILHCKNPESERIYKGQKRFTKGFFEITIRISMKYVQFWYI